MALKGSESGSAEHMRVIYKVNYNANDSFVSLSVIPATDSHYRNGYQSDWNEVKQQVLDLNFKDKSKVPNGLTLIGRIESAGYELPLINQDEYFTALKVAELCGQPLDVMIKTPVEVPQKSVSTASKGMTGMAANKKSLDSKQSSSDSDESNTEFVLLESTKSSVKSVDTQCTADSSTQLGSDNVVVMSKTQIEAIKKEITIDVTKRLISKLNECLQDLTIESTHSSDPVTGTANTETRAEAMAEKSANESTASNPVIHFGIICDNCDLQIKGVRYKCNNCLDFDLCDECKEMPSVHDKSHTFNKIERYIRGINKQKFPQKPSTPQTLDFLKPFLTGATIDPKTRDIFLSLDVDLRNGTIKTSNISQSKPHSSTSAATQASEQNPNPDQTNGDRKSQTTSKASNASNGPQNGSEEEMNATFGPHLVQKRYVSEKKANKIAKKLEKLKFKSQMYNNLLQTSDERSLYGSDRSKPQTSGAHIPNPPINSNKTLYLSGLLVGDETIPDGTRMPPNTRFRKTWKVRNTGTKVWTGRTTLRFVWGQSELEPFGRVTEVQAPALRPGEEGKVTIRFTSPNPSNTTRYQSHWRLHHRGQPFGQRLVCKIIVDPSATGISPVPNALLAPILSKDSKTNTSVPMATRAVPRVSYSPYSDGTYGINQTNCNLQSMASIHQSILESQRNLSDRLKAMANAKQLQSSHQRVENKKLTEALTAVKEIRFNLDSDSIPMKRNVKSHTTTPANTPFDVSPPKSPEPNSTANSFAPIGSDDKNETNDPKEKNAVNSGEDKANESDSDSLDVLSLSSGESCDEFVLVPLPSCFDLNVPFGGVDNKGFEDSKYENSIEKTSNDNNCFEVIDESAAKSEESVGSDDDNTRSDEDNTSLALAKKSTVLVEPNNEIALDLTKDKQHRNVRSEEPVLQNREQSEENAIQSNVSQPENSSEPQVRPKAYNASTNPFRNNTNETENVIHVLPESIVTGALSAAANVYNNVSRAFFSRNEGNNFAWVTSPPPAALPLPDLYWESRRPHQCQPYGPQLNESMSTPNNAFATSAAPVPPNMTTGGPKAQSPSQASRLTSALTQLYEMGFWNQKLNQELLEKNGFDVNDTIEDLLSPGKARQRRTAPNSAPSAPDPVVSHQPQNNRNNGFIEEFD